MNNESNSGTTIEQIKKDFINLKVNYTDENYFNNINTKLLIEILEQLELIKKKVYRI